MQPTCYRRKPRQRAQGKQSHGFNVIPFDTDCQRPRNGFNGYHQLTFSVARYQDAFDPVQGSTADSDALSNFEEWVGSPRQIYLQESSNRRNLVLGNRGPHSVATDQTEYSIYAQCSQSVFVGVLQIHEDVTTEQRQLHLDLAVSPKS